MTKRPTDWHVLDLDRDPVPGDPYEVKELARKLGDFADDVSSALRSVKGLSGNNAVQDWAGLAADAYREQFGDLPGELTKLEKSYRLASGALETYWPKLETAQADADRALAQGRTARQDLDAAKTTQTNVNDWVKRAGDKSKEYQGDPKPGVEPPSAEEVRTATRNALDASNAQKSANTAVHDAQQRLDAAKELAAQAAHLRDTAASTAEHALHEASDAGIKNKHWWEKAVDWVADHWDDIVAVCKVIVAVLGIIVMIIGGPLAWIVLAAALVVLADTLIKYAQGKASLWDVLFAAMDCIPGFKGLTTAGGLLKMAKNLPALLKSGKALENIANSVRKGGQAVKDLAGSLRRGAKDEVKAAKPMEGRCKNGEPVDMVSGEMVLAQKDVDLPGLLPLVLQRTHLSSYRAGRWFGRSWASTLDQRLEVDGDGIVCAVDDGMLLSYPVPRPGEAVLPVHGPRWPLVWEGEAGGEIRITDPAGGWTRRFAPLQLSHGPMTLPIRSMSDRNGHRIDFDYGPDGVPTAVRHSAGYHIAVDSADGRVIGLRLAGSGGPDGTTVMRYSYDAAGDLAGIINSSGLPHRFEYDGDGRITQRTDRNGNWYRFEYDDENRCVQGFGADSFLDCTIAYDVDARTTVYTDSLGNATTYQHNALRQIAAQTDSLGNTTLSEWDSDNRLLSRSDPLGRTTRFAYDGAGNLSGITRPDGSTTGATFNGLRQPLTITGPDGATWHYTYDDRGNRTSITNPGGATTRYSHDSLGRLTAVTDALGGTTRITCSAAGLPTTVVDPLGAVTRYVRDAFGRVTRAANPVGGTTCFAWTTEGKLARRELPDGSAEHWAYDGEGNLVEHLDAAGRATRFVCGQFGLTKRRSTPDGAHLDFSYDTELRLTSVVNAQDLRWTYTYDMVGRLVSETDFNGRTLHYTSDAAGQLTSRTNGVGQTVRFRHDALGRTVAQETDDSVTTFAYDPVGRVLQAVNEDVDLSFTYDGLGRILAATSDDRTLTSEYDLLGRRTGRRTPSGATSAWEWDANGELSTLRSAGRILDFDRDAAGREVERRVGAGLRFTHEWDANHRLTSQSVSASVPGEAARPLQERSYQYSADGYLSDIDELTRGRRHFDVDQGGRVTRVAAENWNETYAYDSAGNVVHAASPDGGDGLGERVLAGTLLRRAGRNRYEYDSQGRVVRKSRKLLSGGSRTWTYTWNVEDRLTDVSTPDGTHWHYTYDALGRRTTKQRLGDDGSILESVTFVWDGSRLAEQHDSGTGRSTTWDWAPNSHRPLAQTDKYTSQDEVDERFYAIVTDLIGTPTELVDEAGAVVWQNLSTLWGVRFAPESGEQAECPLRFPGQYYDQETGLHYNVNRYYDPETARYQSPDPLGLAPSPNPFAYVPNPLHWADVLGLSCTEPSPGTQDDALLALDRAEELQSMRNDYWMAHERGTTAAIGVFDSVTKKFSVRIGINGGGAMPAGWTLKPGEEFFQAAGHAEEGILNNLGPHEFAVYGGTSRNFCNDICLKLIDTPGVHIGGEGIRGHAAQNSPFTLFWSRED
ncbi:RHS repeat protein [Streptomyces sp. SID13666]|uniref:RHS repeat-associated core domain-containing protein n=1 Tax=unclassified Streptomyces TaxID=2593676 RepID=UPI0013C0404A|nr:MULTISPECIES: RHS repeat-associated core domain-containing protein [unclassified Streptomyces]NEA56704.1 RHS repeat protein [Streptomyces sp. SID13666]NEA73148.1 RHS repeat protein [Streptomyces sp. SID13588]